MGAVPLLAPVSVRLFLIILFPLRINLAAYANSNPRSHGAAQCSVAHPNLRVRTASHLLPFQVRADDAPGRVEPFNQLQGSSLLSLREMYYV